MWQINRMVAEINRKSDYPRNDEKQQPDSIQNRNSRIDFADLLAFPVRIQDSAAGGKIDYHSDSKQLNNNRN